MNLYLLACLINYIFDTINNICDKYVILLLIIIFLLLKLNIISGKNKYKLSCCFCYCSLCELPKKELKKRIKEKKLKYSTCKCVICKCKFCNGSKLLVKDYKKNHYISKCEKCFKKYVKYHYDCSTPTVKCSVCYKWYYGKHTCFTEYSRPMPPVYQKTIDYTKRDNNNKNYLDYHNYVNDQIWYRALRDSNSTEHSLPY